MCLSHLVAGETVLQMPLVLGAMSVFHSIPAEHVGTAGLELTPVRSPPLSPSWRRLQCQLSCDDSHSDIHWAAARRA